MAATEELDEEARHPIFISYASPDEAHVTELVEQLERRGHSCWYAKRNIRASSAYNMEIRDQISKCDILVVFVTSHVAESTFVPKEISLAFEKKKDKPTVLPILWSIDEYPDNIALFLTNNQHLERKNFPDPGLFYNVLSEEIDEIYAQRDQRGQSDTEAAVRKPARINNQYIQKLSMVSEEWRSEQSETFVKPDQFHHLLEELRRHRMIQVHHREYTGKFIAALMALGELGVQQAYEWSMVNSLTETLRYDMPEHSGIIFETGYDLDTLISGQLTERDMEKYSEYLRKSNSYFVIITSTSQPHAYFKNKHIAWEGERRTRVLLRAYITGKFTGDQAERLLDLLEQDDMFPAQILPRECKPLVEKMERYVQGELDKPSFIASHQTNTVERIESWFFKHANPDDVAFYLTLTLYEQYPFAYIKQKSAALADALAVVMPQTPNDAPLLSRDRHLEKYYAHVVKMMKVGYIGEAREQDVVVFKYLDDRKEIWNHFWSQYAQYQSIVVDWLAEIQKSGQPVIRKRVSSLLVQLMTGHLDDVIYVVILKWLKSQHSGDRVFLIRVLEEYAQTDREAAKTVYQLIRKWSVMKQSNMEWMAVKLLGSQVALINYEESLRILRKLYESGNANVRNAVKKSLSYLTNVVVGGRQYEEFYYKFWIDWIVEREEEGSEIILMMTVFFGQNLNLFFEADPKYDKSFWIKYFLSCQFLTGKEFDRVRTETQRLSNQIYKSSKLSAERERRFAEFESQFSKVAQINRK